ncbi:MAG: M4 family metallopeptidase [Nocardioidaceae bacterium]|nr:M4 family metallopeptidase [Nocardioidaceae bacterium]
MTRCQFIPPYLLRRLAGEHSDFPARSSCRSTLEVDDRLRSRRAAVDHISYAGVTAAAETPAGRPGDSVGVTAPQTAWTIHDAANGATLPGERIRSTGDAPSGDDAVDEAYAGTEATVSFYADVLARASFDDLGAPVVVTVHYERDYDNAFWDGHQLVFGDGDGRVFDRFTKPVDVLAHEFTHAVTQFTARLTYQGQPGALNESVSDVFASCVKQRLLDQPADEADWLIGAGIFQPAVQGRALRSMKDPGTAYDDPTLGKDPQVAHVQDYVTTTDDNGGVHINSGIPNRAFALAATALGGHSWEVAGPIWYRALTGGAVVADTDFARFAQATIDAAEQIGGAGTEVVTAVTEAWHAVGVTPGVAAPAPAPGSPIDIVHVRRSGGFAGRTAQGELRPDDPRSPEVRALVSRIDFASIKPSHTQPDRFIYVFTVDGREVVVQEHQLTDDLRLLASLVLDDTR